MKILLTNDDGIDAPGMLALYQAAKNLGDVYVVAPAGVCSAKSHSVTLFSKMTVTDYANDHFAGKAVDGMPADCVKLGCNGLVDGPIDLVISGINAGANIGINVLYSGTVAAAREAAIQGIPAIAMSLHLGKAQPVRWDVATQHATDILQKVLAHDLPTDHVLNINLPIFDNDHTIKGLRVCPLSDSAMADRYAQTKDEQGNDQYHVDFGMKFRKPIDGSDVHFLFDRYSTISPVLVYQTQHHALSDWGQKLDL